MRLPRRRHQLCNARLQWSSVFLPCFDRIGATRPQSTRAELRLPISLIHGSFSSCSVSFGFCWSTPNGALACRALRLSQPPHSSERTNRLCHSLPAAPEDVLTGATPVIQRQLWRDKRRRYWKKLTLIG